MSSNFHRTLLISTLTLIMLGVFSCSKPDVVHAEEADTTEFDLDTFVEGKMKELNINGASLVVIRDGKIDELRAYGLANVETGQPVRKDTIFEVASISKSIFSQFVMTYVEAGKLDLDIPLHDYLPHPDLPDSDWHRAITARMVLSHRSGLPNWRENEPEQILRIKFEPGTDYEYSGEGYQYLALVLRAIEGTDWAGLDEIFRSRIASPLGLENLSFVPSPAMKANKAEPYDQDGTLIDWRNNYWHTRNDGVFVAASSAHTTAENLGRWIVGLMDREILGNHSYEAIFSPITNLSEEGQTSRFPPHYGLGYVVTQTPLGPLIGHTGTNEGFTSYFGMLPDRRWGFAVLTNSESGVQLGSALLQILD